LALRDEVLDRIRAVVRDERQAALVLVIPPELDRAGLLGDDRRILRPTRLEQLRHPRQTAGDVARLGALHPDTGEDVASLDAGAGTHADDRGDRGRRARLAATGELGDLAVLVVDDDGGPEIRRAGRAAPVDDDALGDAGRLVDLFR